jgi:hypothetical protein
MLLNLSQRSTRFATLLVTLASFATAGVAQTVIATIPTPDPQQLDVNPLNRLVYVANAGAGTIQLSAKRPTP